MKYLSQKEIASVQLIDVEASEDELDVYQRCLSYILEHVDPKQMEEEFGATSDEILDMVESMEDVMATPVQRIVQEYFSMKKNCRLN